MPKGVEGPRPPLIPETPPVTEAVPSRRMRREEPRPLPERDTGTEEAPIAEESETAPTDISDHPDEHIVDTRR